MKNKSLVLGLASVILPILLFGVFDIAQAQTLISEGQLPKNGFYSEVSRIGDPIEQEQRIYGRLESAGYNIYGFIAKHDGKISIKLKVPYRLHNQNFHPQLISIQKGENTELDLKIPFQIPSALAVKSEGKDNRKIIESDSKTLEKYFGTEPSQIDLIKGKSYYFAVFDPQTNSGDYVLSLTDVNEKGDEKSSRIFDILKIKLGLLGKNPISALNFLGLFMVLAGFIIGLGAVTVIDLHGWLARKSSYWTEATIRSHKVTKPLIWLGILLLTAGLILTYRLTVFSGTALFHLFLIIILISNGIYLSFFISPLLLKLEREGDAQQLLSKILQRKITISFVVSFLGWWLAVLVFAWHIILTS